MPRRAPIALCRPRGSRWTRLARRGSSTRSARTSGGCGVWSAEAERVAQAAPPQPDPQQVTDTEQRYALVRLAEERVLNRIRVTERALGPAGFLAQARA